MIFKATAQSKPSGLYPNVVIYLTFDYIKQNSMVYKDASVQAPYPTTLYLKLQSERSGLSPDAVIYLTYDNIRQNIMVY